jgi:hypothetical protein
LCLLGLGAALIEWRWWWARAKGVYVVLLFGVAISLAAALLTTNNFGGAAVGFRHAVHLSPVFAVLVLPWITTRSPARQAAIVAVAGVSAAVLLVFAVREPWSELTLSAAPIGALGEYVPIISRAMNGDLLGP